MQVYRTENPAQSLCDGSFTLEKTAVALGGFDGIHIGHQSIINRVVADAKEKGLTSVVYLFRNQPRGVIQGGAAPSVYSLEQRLALLEELGVDVVIAEWFTEDYRQVSPEAFVKDYLKDWLDARVVAAGFNYRFGSRGAGDMQMLKTLCQPLGIAVYEGESVSVDGELVSSTRIREHIKNGELTNANRCLGRTFSIMGKVVAGNRLGRTIGFPTANVACEAQTQLLKRGVYVTQAKADGVWYPAITNVGARPTVTDATEWVETHLLNYQGDLYGKTVEIAFYEYLRAITAFASLEELKTQLEADKSAAKQYFKNQKENV